MLHRTMLVWQPKPKREITIQAVRQKWLQCIPSVSWTRKSKSGKLGGGARLELKWDEYAATTTADGDLLRLVSVKYTLILKDTH